MPRVLVPSCRNCNSLGGAHLQTDLASRRAYIQRRIKEKYAKDLAFKMPKDFDLYGPNMKRRLRRAEAKKNALLRRLAFSSSPESRTDETSILEKPEC